jgi:(p)ppGpp synthase/HD superfamily hydrolase
MGLLANVSSAITVQGVNITSAQIKTERGKAIIKFELTVSDAQQLNKIKRAIEMVSGVIKVERVLHLGGASADGADDDDE